MIEINLLPDVKRELLRTRMARNFIISLSTLIGIGSIVVVVVLGIIVGSQIGVEAIQDGSIKDKNAKLMAVPNLNEAVTLQHQLSVIGTMHDNKKIYSRTLDVMQAINPSAPNNVSISVLKLDPENKTITIEGAAANGYLALEVFKKTILNTSVEYGEGGENRSPLAQNFSASEAGFGEDNEGKRVLQFSFTFNYPEELFISSKDKIEIVTPTERIDVTDSKLGVPDSLFDGGGSAKNDKGGKDGKQ